MTKGSTNIQISNMKYFTFPLTVTVTLENSPFSVYGGRADTTHYLKHYLL